MLFTKIKYNNNTIYPHQIDNNDFYFKLGSLVVEYPYRLEDLPDFYVGNEILNITKNATVNSLNEELNLNSAFNFSVKGDKLIFKQV